MVPIDPWMKRQSHLHAIVAGLLFSSIQDNVYKKSNGLIKPSMSSRQGSMQNVIDNEKKNYRWKDATLSDSTLDFETLRKFTSMQTLASTQQNVAEE